MCNSKNTNAFLPGEVLDFVESIVRMSSWRRRIRDEIRRELLAHFEDALENVPEETRAEAARRMIRDFGQPAILGKLIHRGKKRCQPSWEKAVWNLVKAMALLVILLPTAAWVAGQRAEQVYQATVARLREQGALRDIAQLESVRPPDTVFFTGRDEDCATSLFFSLERDESLMEETATPFEWLPEMDEDKEKALRELVAAHGESLSRLRHAAEMPPTSLEQMIRVTILASPKQKPRVPSGVMAYVRLMLINAFLLHRAGNDDEALMECQRAVSAAGHIRDIPLVICQLMATRTEIDLARVLAPISLSPSLSGELARAFAGDWDLDWKRMALAQALEFEAGNVRTRLHESKQAIVLLTQVPLRVRLLAMFYFTPFMRTLSAPDETQCYEAYRDLAACARMPFFQMRERAEELEARARQRSMTGTAASRLLSAHPALADRLSDNAFAETRMLEALTALALHRYKAERGHYPDGLDALVPDYLPTLPADPYSGNNLSYLLFDRHYLLYSVGYNGCDETAQHARVSGNAANALAPSDDVVWGVFSLHEPPLRSEM